MALALAHDDSINKDSSCSAGHRGMSALIFIALTTPLIDLFIVMKQCRIPEAIVDLTMIIYRSIFMVMDQLVQTYRAQLMRLGYSSLRESIQSFATLCGSVFISSWDAAEDFIRAMDARCYSGKFVVFGETRPVEAVPTILVGAFLAVSSLVVIATQGVALI